MSTGVNQGDILQVESVSRPVLVVSTNYFHGSGAAMVCPIFPRGDEGVLHRRIRTSELQGVVHCEQVKMLDLRSRGYKKVGRIGLNEQIDISDMLQGLFDYM